MQIEKGSYSMGGSEWRDVTDEAKDLVRCLLTINPTARLSVDQVLTLFCIVHVFRYVLVTGVATLLDHRSATKQTSTTSLLFQTNFRH
jgi:hypothetical protein